MFKQPISLSMILGVVGLLYACTFWLMVTINADHAEDRFTTLVDSGAGGRAIGHGEQVIAIRANEGVDAEDLVEIKLTLAALQADEGNYARSIRLYRDVLASRKAASMPVTERAIIRDEVARLSLADGQPQDAAVIYSAFLEAAGDEAARQVPAEPDSLEAFYAGKVRAAMPIFAEALPPIHDDEVLTGDDEMRLAAAAAMTDLGGYYAMQDNGDYAAAGLLSAAYQTRLKLLGAASQDTLQTALLLGPVYQKIGRYKDTETLYLTAFHAQEQARGSNSPELTLYIRLLADVYKSQNRLTEAEALNTHIRRLFSDAFGARRYLSNQIRDRRMDINRPVSLNFPLTEDYKPSDLVQAADFSVPLSKSPGLEEMSIRLAELVADDATTAMPSQLNTLFAHCAIEGERLTLRSGYRSYQTQVYLYDRNTNGTVTNPGTSEHQLGLAADIDVNGRLMRSTDRAYQCFEENAWRFGFILSYPPGNDYLPGPDTYEPWHWRYVGQQTALLYREAGPINKPQEFLAALPCYEERAMAGIWSIASEEDVCLAQMAGPPGGATGSSRSQKAP
ncbi:D-alanyl-D-alanine carboxypeptidase family protein [Aquisalinus luteolus]|nr:D-alanyl-D-alanine carboxypeptidase family protein [Aquisalinus luteolus]